MAIYWVTERKNVSLHEETSEWQERVANLPGLDVLLCSGKRMKVQIDDYIVLQVSCGDICSIDKVS
jgi:hypothetical protein